MLHNYIIIHKYVPILINIYKLHNAFYLVLCGTNYNLKKWLFLAQITYTPFDDLYMEDLV